MNFEQWLSATIDSMTTDLVVESRKAAQGHVLDYCGEDYMRTEYFENDFTPFEAALEEVDACVANFPLSQTT